jgi:hypothetical protein
MAIAMLMLMLMLMFELLDEFLWHLGRQPNEYVRKQLLKA